DAGPAVRGDAPGAAAGRVVRRHGLAAELAVPSDPPGRHDGAPRPGRPARAAATGRLRRRQGQGRWRRAPLHGPQGVTLTFHEKEITMTLPFAEPLTAVPLGPRVVPEPPRP